METAELKEQLKKQIIEFLNLISVKPEDIKDDENLKCKFCQNKAQIHCENCQVYFCKTCDDLVHGGDEIEAHDEKGRIMN